ncbi:hypothetical protein G3T14_18930, partial [Methylobacterium sp. BTF04]|uniref:putative phage abortive infection protein n=1 Tax=Methylobacterium sp. BTF04 TaxID=2708300 RepID=UPI0013FE5618
MPKLVIWGIAAALGLWLAWVFQGIILNAAGVGWDSTKLGQWGDSFGVLNALFATLGFGAALYTLRIQQQQISRDRFDTYFFELLKLFIDSREKVTFRYSPSYIKTKKFTTNSLSFTRNVKYNLSYSGLDAFHHAWMEVRYWNPDIAAPADDLIKTYDTKIHSRSEVTLGPYFRLLYTILKRIRTDRYLSGADKVLYGNLIRSQPDHLSVSMFSRAGAAGGD